jgi:hypothetical protein
MSENPTPLFCANHPNVETQLRCNRCEKPICNRCAVLTPTGYRCKECVRGQQKVFENAQWYDYPLAFILAGVLSFLGSLLVRYVGFFTIFIAPVAAVIIAEAARKIVRNRRSRQLWLLTAGAAALGSLPVLLIMLFALLNRFGLSVFGLSLIWQAVYTFTVTSTVYYRMGGIQIR